MYILRLETKRDKGNTIVPGFYKRKKPCKEKDITFYQQLSLPDRLFILECIQKKIIKFDVDDFVMNEGNYDEISSLLPVIKLIDYSVKNGKTKEFKQFIDNHRSLFKRFANYRIIQPR